MEDPKSAAVVFNFDCLLELPEEIFKNTDAWMVMPPGGWPAHGSSQVIFALSVDETLPCSHIQPCGSGIVGLVWGSNAGKRSGHIGPILFG